MQINPYKY